MLKELIPCMAEEERLDLAAQVQGHGHFKKAEHKLEQRCLQTIGTHKVKYEGPSKTDLREETDARRRTLCRKLQEYSTFQAIEASRISRMGKFLEGVERDMFDESLMVECRLGVFRCPCRGIRLNHTFYTWFLGDEEYEEQERRWKTCIYCGNLYDPHAVAMLDFLLRLYYRLKQRRGMIMTESPTISYVRIKMQLFPQLQELLEVGDAGVTAVQEAVLAAVGIFIDKNCNWRQAPPPPPLTCGRTPLQRLKDLVKERAPTQPDTPSLFDYGFSQPDEEEVALAEQRGSLTMQV